MSPQFAGASLALNFLSGSLDPRITFTRGSNATLVDATGKITYAPNNLALNSQNLSSWTADGANVTSATEIAPDGTATAALLTAASGNNRRYMATTFPVGVAVIFSVYVKQGTAATVRTDVINQVSGPTFTFATQAYSGGVGISNHTVTPLANGWFRLSFQLTISTANVGPAVAMIGAAVGSTVLVWGQQAEAVTYQTTPSTYVATTSAAYYGPRFDYDPVTLAAKGLLIEEQRTNLQTYSSQFDNAVYGKVGILAFGSGSTIDAAVAPDGTTTADLLTENTSNSRHGFDTTFTGISAGSYTWSIFLKSNGRSAVDFVAYGSGMTVRTINNVAISSGVDLGNGWYRVSWTFNVSAPPTSMVIETWMNNGSSGTYTGNGTSGMYFWGAQLEAGAFATSYIPTVASQVTRTADVAAIVAPNFAPWYNQSEGTFVGSFDAFSPTSTMLWAGISDGTSGNRVQSGSSSGSALFVNVGGVSQVSLSSSAITADTITNRAIAYKTDDFAVCTAGGLVATDALGGLPTVNRLAVGGVNSGSQLNGHIRQIAYYNTRLPDATLQALTA